MNFAFSGVLDRLEVGPAAELADELAGGQAAEFILGNREADDRAGLRIKAGGGVFLEEGNIGVAVEGVDDTGVAAGGELLDLGDDLLVVGVAEGGVFAGGDDLAIGILGETTADVLKRHSLAEEILEKDQVGGLRIDIVGADQIELLLALFEHVVDGWSGLLVHSLGGVEDVGRHFLALVLHRVEEQALLSPRTRAAPTCG
jgi:hypothetical protein